MSRPPGDASGGGFFRGALKALGVVAIGAAMFGLIVYAALPTFQGPDRHAAKAMEGEFPLIGAWLGEWPSEENGTIADFNERGDVRIDLVDVFLDWKTPWDNVSYTVEHISHRGAIAVLTWEPRDFTNQQIIQGRAETPLRDGRVVSIDDYVAEFAEGACDVADRTKQPILIRTLHEMNGHWYPWGLGYEIDGEKPNSPESFRQAWIKVHDEFDSRCGDDVRFVYAINHFSGGGTTFMAGYPGDEYVDFIGIDGYNWGSRAEWGWQSFDTLFKDPYCAVTAESSRPVLITETGSSESGGDKAGWIRDSYSVMLDGSYPQVRGIVYFDETKYEIEIGGEMDWSLGTSESSIEAFRDVAKEIQGLREDADTWTPPAGDPVC